MPWMGNLFNLRRISVWTNTLNVYEYLIIQEANMCIGKSLAM